MDETELRLVKVFHQVFPSMRGTQNIKDALMSEVPEWDSLTHMNLMLALCDEFTLGSLSAEDFVKLSSYVNILSFLRERL